MPEEFLRLLLGGVGWGLGTLFAGQGDSPIKMNSEKVALVFSTDLMKKHLGKKITKSSSFPTNTIDPDEKQISMKRKVQAHSPSTSGQSGILVLNLYSITN